MNDATLRGMPAMQPTTVKQLRVPDGHTVEPGMLERLAELGFLPGETLVVLRRGPGGKEPIAVQIGDTVFALRAIEADCVHVMTGAAS